ncbi:MAG: cupin domain-containing protein [Pseudohongiellaceae bacterium]
MSNFTALFAPTFDNQKFFRHYWQKRPLLIKSNGAFADPLDPDTLAAMACEAAVDSRIVTNQGAHCWQQASGPFTSRYFKNLGESNWTLLVQAVDQWWPPMRSLRAEFDFLPGWRIDDIMVSFATRGGGVGPHFDYYDVFLVQGKGSRKWQVGNRCEHTTALCENSELKLLKVFKPRREFILTSGDILYLPPRYAHFGVALNDSLCYSVGFRAPSFAEMLEGYSNELAQTMPDDLRYEDTLKTAVSRSGEISNAMLAPTFKMLKTRMDDMPAFNHWFGCQVTTPRHPEQILPVEPPVSAAAVRQMVHRRTGLRKNPFSRFAYSKSRNKVSLYVDGRCYVCSVNSLVCISQLCASCELDLPLIKLMLKDRDLAGLVTELLNIGSLEIEPGQ